MRLQTERLILRPYEPRDRDDLALLHADPKVKQFFPATLNREESDRSFDKSQAAYNQNGFHFMAAELADTSEFVGILGIAKFDDDFVAAVPNAAGYEIGWQLRPQYWGKGLASEGALAWLDFAWQQLKLSEMLAITVLGNTPSRRVMEKIGMHYDLTGDFEHPGLPQGHKLRPHVLYRIKNPDLNPIIATAPQ